MKGLLLSALLIGILVLAGCTAQPAYPAANATVNQSLPAQNVSNPVVNPQPQQGSSDLAVSHNTFGFNLFSILSNGSGPDENILISPASIELALSMVYAGSAGTTRDAMGSALALGNISPDMLNQESFGLMQSLSNRSDVNLSIANSLWVNSAMGFRFRQDYQANMAAYYNATAQALNFSDEPASANAINGWVGDKTNGKITSIVSPDVLSTCEAALVDAVYFKGKWTTPFDKNLTQDMAFTAGNGSQVQVPMMSQGGNYMYFQENDSSGTLQAIMLPYGNGSGPGISMYVFLPGNMNSFLQGLNESTWNGMMDEFSADDGTILLPKFTYEYGTDLVPQLTGLGMGVAFSNAANFTNMSDIPLKISTVLHKAYISTDEEGTEAAAVTFVGVVETTAVAPRNPPFYMEVDRPFFYAIVDENTGEILFMGVVNDPSTQ